MFMPPNTSAISIFMPTEEPDEAESVGVCTISSSDASPIPMPASAEGSDRQSLGADAGQPCADRVAAEETLPTSQRAQVEQHTAEKFKQHHDKEVKPCPVQVRRHSGGQNDGRILPKGSNHQRGGGAVYIHHDDGHNEHRQVEEEGSQQGIEQARSTAVPRHPSTTASMRPLVRPSRTPTSALTSILEPSERSNDPQEKMKVAPVATSATSDALATTTSSRCADQNPAPLRRRYSPANAAQAPAGIQRVEAAPAVPCRRRASRIQYRRVLPQPDSPCTCPLSRTIQPIISRVGQLRGRVNSPVSRPSRRISSRSDMPDQFRQLLRNHDDSFPFLLHLIQQAVHGLLDTDVNAARRAVQDRNVRAATDPFSEHHLLLVSPR